ncbi:MAG: DinB family protein [Pyrinomonadaceae bacterium]
MTGPQNNLSEFLQDFRQTLEVSSARLMEIPETKSQISSREGEWSPKQIIGHLIDSAANNHQRFVRAQLSNDLVHDGYQQDEWVKVQRYNEAPWSQLVQLWKLYNQHLAHVMAAMPEEELTRVREKHSLDQIAWQTVDKATPTTLDYLVRDYVAHMKSHLSQIL